MAVWIALLIRKTTTRTFRDFARHVNSSNKTETFCRIIRKNYLSITKVTMNVRRDFSNETAAKRALSSRYHVNQVSWCSRGCRQDELGFSPRKRQHSNGVKLNLFSTQKVVFSLRFLCFSILSRPPVPTFNSSTVWTHARVYYLMSAGNVIVLTMYVQQSQLKISIEFKYTLGRQ